jgi:hypothetical protein
MPETRTDKGDRGKEIEMEIEIEIKTREEKDVPKRKEKQGPVLKLAHTNGIFGGKPRGSADDGGVGEGGGGWSAGPFRRTVGTILGYGLWAMGLED